MTDGDEDAPAGTEVEAIDLDHVMDDAGGWEVGTEFPTPGDTATKRTACAGSVEGCLIGFPEEPVCEVEQGEEPAAIVSFADR